MAVRWAIIQCPELAQSLPEPAAGSMLMQTVSCQTRGHHQQSDREDKKEVL